MAANTPTARVIEGWLVKYNLPSRPLTLPSGRQVFEVIQTDAFVESVNAINAGTEAAIECDIEHKKNDALMRLGTSDINVKVENRSEGVYATVALINDTISDDIFKRINAGFVRGFSIEFDPRPKDAEPAYELINGNYLRKWARITLRGFAVTADPMYPDATITKVTEGEQVAAFARSMKQADIDLVTAEIEQLEMQRQHLHYKYESFLLGIGR